MSSKNKYKSAIENPTKDRSSSGKGNAHSRAKAEAVKSERIQPGQTEGSAAIRAAKDAISGVSEASVPKLDDVAARAAIDEALRANAKLITGVVGEVFPKMANVIVDGDDLRRVLCTYRRAQIVDRDAEWRQRAPVAPGDRVVILPTGSRDGTIEEVYPRLNSLGRRAPGREGKILHTIAANIDFVVVVASLREPDFSPGLIDRFLVATTTAQIVPVIVINKMDLRIGDEKPWQLYEDLGYRCFPISTENQTGIETLRTEIKGKTSVFCGHSGVGKTSLLAVLFGEDVGRVGGISKATGKGKHTTTVSKLIMVGDGTRFIDTPGIKEFGLLNVDPKNLIEHFPELWELQKNREPYEHLPRYQTYLKIKAALEDEGR